MIILKLVFMFLVLGNYGLQVPLSPQAQQANPNAVPPLVQPNNPYGFTGNLDQQLFSQINSGSTIYTIVSIGIIIFSIFFILLILTRYRQLETAYVGEGRRISGRYRLFIWGKGWIDFRATEVLPEDQLDTLEVIKEIDELKVRQDYTDAIEKIRHKVRTGSLYLYEIKVISRKNMRLRGNFGYSILLSNEPIDDRKYFYESRNAVFSPFSGTWREHPRIVDCIAQSRVFLDVEMADRARTTTVYVVGPVSGDFATNKQLTFGERLEDFHINPVSINVNLISVGAKELSEILTIMRTIADTYKIGKTKDKMVKALEGVIDKLSSKSVIDSSEKELMKSKVGERALVILGERIVKRERQESWVWLLVAIFMGFVGYQIPQWFPQLSGTDPKLTFVIMEGFVLLMKMAFEKQSEDPSEKYKKEMHEVRFGEGQRSVL
jgi:hypothetical protein